MVLGRVRVGALAYGAPYYELLLDQSLPPIPLDRWLKEWIVRPNTVLPSGGRVKGFIIDKIIQEAANEEAAHAEDDYGPTLARMDGRVETSGIITRQEHEMAIVALGEYIAARTRELMAERRDAPEND